MLNNVDPNAVTCDTSKTGFNMLLRQPQHGSCIACCTNQSQRHRAPQDRTTVSADATASRGIVQMEFLAHCRTNVPVIEHSQGGQHSQRVFAAIWTPCNTAICFRTRLLLILQVGDKSSSREFTTATPKASHVACRFWRSLAWRATAHHLDMIVCTHLSFVQHHM